MLRIGLNLLGILVGVSVKESAANLNRDLEWLSVCPGGDGGKRFIIHDTGRCKLGFYFKSSHRDLCVCGNGVWKLNSDVCGQNVLIDAVDGDCFEVPGGTGLRWIRHLGHPHEPKKEFNFVTDQSMTDIVPLLDDGFTDAGYAYVGTVNPRRSFSDCSNQVCYKMGKSVDKNHREGDTLPRLLWGPIPKDQGMYATTECRPSTQGQTQHFPFGIPSRGLYYTNANPGESQSPISLRHVPSEKCRQRCLPNFGNMSFDDTLWGDERIKNSYGIIDWASVTNPSAATSPLPALPPPETNTTSITSPTYPFSIDLVQGASCKISSPPAEISDKLKKNLGAQTQRMVSAHYDAVILGKRAPLVTMPEFEYLRTGSLIFQKVCPATEVPPELLKALLVLFRVALNESLGTHPYVHLGDKEEDERLKASLDACLASAEKKHFRTTYNTTQCPPKLSGYFMERDAVEVPLDANVPCQVSSNTSVKFDYPVEAAWKLGLFTHYFCASHFNVTAFDHSRLEYKLRQLFNKEIITRWYHPGRSSKVFRHIFREYDLDSFMLGMDRCVTGAKQVSPYPTWIKRPKFEGGIPHIKVLGKIGGRGYDEMIPVLKGLGRCVTQISDMRVIANSNCTNEIKPPTCITTT